MPTITVTPADIIAMTECPFCNAPQGTPCQDVQDGYIHALRHFSCRMRMETEIAYAQATTRAFRPNLKGETS